MIAILLVIFMGIFFIIKGSEFYMSSTKTSTHEMSRWSEYKFVFDSDLNFLENSLWILGENSAYQNGRNGSLYNEPWDMISGFVCWNCKKGIPPEDLVASQLLKRVNKTYEKYFDKLSIVVENHTNLNMTYDKEDKDKIKFFYKGNFSFYPSDDFYTNATNLWINSTTPLVYFNLYDKGKEFVQNEKINDKLEDAVDSTTVCVSSGELTKDEVINKTKDVLKYLSDHIWNAGRWPGEGIGIHLSLVDLKDFSSVDYPKWSWPPWIPDKYEYAYMINFSYVVNTTVRDENEFRMVPTEDGMKYLDLVFGLNKSISFMRYVDDLSKGGIDSKCDTTWPSSAQCTPNYCEYWVRKGRKGLADDCRDDEYCYVEKKDKCDCEPFYGCTNKKGCYRIAETCEDACKEMGYSLYVCIIGDFQAACNYEGTGCFYDIINVTTHDNKKVVCIDNGKVNTNKNCYCYRYEECLCKSGMPYSCDNTGCIGPVAVFFKNDNYNTELFNVTESEIVNGYKFIGDLTNYNGENYNDMIASLAVKSGYKVTLYENTEDEGLGDHITFYGPTVVSNLEDHERKGYWECYKPSGRYCPNDWNGQVSAINVTTYNPETDKPLVILYIAKDFTGSNREFNETNVEFNLHDYDFEKVTSSIKIKKGYDLVVWDESGGSHLITENEILDLSEYEGDEIRDKGYWNDKIVKIKIMEE